MSDAVNASDGTPIALGPIVRVEGLCISHPASGRALVEGVGFSLGRGRCLGIVGESGSGKTLVCRALLASCRRACGRRVGPVSRAWTCSAPRRKRPAACAARAWPPSCNSP